LATSTSVVASGGGGAGGGAGVRLPPVQDLANAMQYVKIGESNDNVGIVRLTVTPVPKQARTYQVFAGLMNASDKTKDVAVGLAYGTKDHIIEGKARRYRRMGRIR
jgi:hypothetical protein